MLDEKHGGEGGIRTHGTLSRTHAFQACALNHSATSPSVNTRVESPRAAAAIAATSRAMQGGGFNFKSKDGAFNAIDVCIGFQAFVCLASLKRPRW
jgi:hypothetical protein